MSVSLREVIEAGGYDLETVEDAEWLLSKENEFDELIERAEAIVEAENERNLAEAEADYLREHPEENENEETSI